MREVEGRPLEEPMLPLILLSSERAAQSRYGSISSWSDLLKDSCSFSHSENRVSTLVFSENASYM